MKSQPSKIEIRWPFWYSQCHSRCPAVETSFNYYNSNSSPVSAISAHPSMNPPPYRTSEILCNKLVPRGRGRAAILARSVRSRDAAPRIAAARGFGASVASATTTDDAPLVDSRSPLAFWTGFRFCSHLMLLNCLSGLVVEYVRIALTILKTLSKMGVMESTELNQFQGASKRRWDSRGELF